MLTITIPAADYFDDEKQVFVNFKEVTLSLEHSLVSLSKWEAIWEKPFMGPEEKSIEETLGYIEQMCITPGVSPETFQRLSNDNMTEINEYINAKMSATWFNEKAGQGKGPRREIVTSELLYYWMFSAQIPLECEHWHLNRLMTLLRVFSEKNSPPKKTNPQEAAAQRRMLNEQRLAKLKTTG